MVTTRISFYNLLPSIYHSGGNDGEKVLLHDFLKAFEDVLLGQENGAAGLSAKGLVEILEHIQDYFDPATTPDEFVEWLAGWVALDVSSMIEESDHVLTPLSHEAESKQHFPYEDEKRGIKRHLIKKLAPLFHLRGTKEGLRQVIDIYFGDDLRNFYINELSKPFVIGDPEGLEKVRSDYANRVGEQVSNIDFEEISINTLLERENYDALGSVVGRSTVVGEAPSYYFIVSAETLVPVSRVSGANTKKEMGAVIDQEKPAHTYYSLKLRAPGMRVGIRDWCDVGRSTLIGGFEI